MIKRITINNLFGRFCYDITLKDGGVTIITGPNGFGKSTILRVIDALSSKNYYFFHQIKFDEIKIEFDNCDSFKVKKENNYINFNGIIVSNRKLMSDETLLDNYSRLIRNSSEHKKDFYIDRTNENSNFYGGMLDNIIANNSVSLNYLKTLDRYEKLNNSFDKYKVGCGEVRFISEQRLIKRENIRRDEERIIDVISELPNQLKEEINIVYSEYSKVANSLDGSYPKRLFAAKEGISNETDFNEKLDETNSKLKKLIKYGLVDMKIIEDTSYTDKFAEALKIYFDDFTKKYAVFEKLIKKLDLFTQIINQRLSFKEINISRQKGFEVVDSDNKDHKLRLSQLSSGEKQEIVLFYDLIFNTKSELLLLIDEPEISLHISWQKKFMDDLLKVAEDNNIQIVVATHSPQIINNHWDIQIDLGDKYHEQLNKELS
ncbi:MAG: AAA family ATPase [Ruminococcus sp.]|uniref:AAA family ATPase n=1 Tax=Ruminococcus sp. TaxID=41978 RepID=UPI0025D0EFB6|nr:AAA family ATPase [Ruminococcus sp.]MCR5600402.1 AAA family ATPase [Ruminococcus sp.]